MGEGPVNKLQLSEEGLLSQIGSECLVLYLFSVSLGRTANARNVRLYYPYWQYTDPFIFRFESLSRLNNAS